MKNNIKSNPKYKYYKTLQYKINFIKLKNDLEKRGYLIQTVIGDYYDN